MERLFLSRFFSPAAVLVIAASVLLAYSNAFHSGFQFDDLPAIVESRALRDLGNVFAYMKTTRGITLVTFALNYAVGGLDTFGYHVVNIAVHIVNSVLAYFLLLFTLRLSGAEEARSRAVSALSALIFALHPIQTQAVTYIIQRMESLSSLFYLAGLLFLIKGSSAGGPAKRAALYIGVAASYMLGFWSKETAITFPAAALLYDFFFLSKLSAKKALRERWALHAALLALFLVFSLIMIKQTGGFGDVSEGSAFKSVRAEADNTQTVPPEGLKETAPRRKEGLTAGFTTDIDPKHYLYTQFNVLVYYITLLAYPANQNLDYDFPVSFTLLDTPRLPEGAALNMPIPPPAVSLFVLCLVIGAAIYLFLLARKGGGPATKITSFFIFWFFIIVSPTSSFVPIADVIYEHRVYLASLGFFTIFAVFLEGLVFWAARKKAKPAGPS